MEIELRAKIQDGDHQNIKNILLSKGASPHAPQEQMDTYFKHEGEEIEKMVIRTRRDVSNRKAMLTFKGKSKGADDIAWQDFDAEIPYDAPEQVESVLKNNGYVLLCIIHKIRHTYALKDLGVIFEINIDTITNLGDFIEVEVQGNESEIEVIKEKIIELLNTLGIKKEDIIYQGYVQMMRKKL